MSTIAPAPPTTARMIVAGPDVPGAAQILTPEALEFVATLHELFAARRHEILQARQRARALIEDGVDPDFLPETRHMSTSDPAMRVKSRKPDAAKFSTASFVSSARSSAVPQMVKAIRCGRWDTIATTRSCVAGSSVSIIDPQRRQNSRTFSTAIGSLPGSGVTMQ